MLFPPDFPDTYDSILGRPIFNTFGFQVGRYYPDPLPYTTGIFEEHLGFRHRAREITFKDLHIPLSPVRELLERLNEKE